MVRPLKADRGSIALTHVRISLATKRLIDDLRLKRGFTTTDQVLRYYLPTNVADNRPIFHSTRELYDLTKRQPDINKLISSASKEIYHKYVSPRQRTVRLPVSGNRVKRFTD